MESTVVNPERSGNSGRGVILVAVRHRGWTATPRSGQVKGMRLVPGCALTEPPSEEASEAFAAKLVG